MRGFRTNFTENTLPVIAEKHIWDEANKRSLRNNTDPDEEFEKVNKEYESLGAYPFTFDSGTSPAVKQLRHKLLLANCGAINYQVDEIGSNLIDSTELLTLFLELYDQGQVKEKITKNTSDNKRLEVIEGKTPANMLLFGTPSKLLDGGKTEDLFYAFLETGYARRCIYGWGHMDRKAYVTLSAEEIYRQLIQPKNETVISKWKDLFTELSKEEYYNWKMVVEDDVAIKLLEYKIACERIADELPEHAEIQKAELSHRYYKSLKIAGALAFIDKSVIVTMNHLLQAILLVEESGESFKTILNREKAHVRLFKYLVDVEHEVTHADLHDALPFYKSSAAARNELLTLARAHAYKQHAIIKTRYEDNIELISAEALKETNLDEMILSFSNHFAYYYEPEKAPFNQLHIAFLHEDLHWANHQFKNGHRSEENAIKGFNMVVIDVDEGTNLTAARELLKDYKHIIYTTKRHTEEQNRFRLILPTNYELKLDSEEYVEFMHNVCLWLPFSVDVDANQRSRKWLSNPNAQYFINEEGDFLDALNFIPRTSKNEQYIKEYKQVDSLDNLERWFAQRMTHGNRNNQMIKYALALLDSGFDLPTISSQVHSFNKKLSNPLPSNEIDATVLKTVAKRIVSNE